MGNRPILRYFTDPICSACFVFEPLLDRFLKEHRDKFDYEIHMGGMVPDEDSFYDPMNGINGPEDVAGHWKEMGDAFGVKINTDMWKNDPMTSSFPPSLAVKAAQIQDKTKGEKYLKIIRDMVFVDGLNIDRIENLHKAAKELDLDIEKFDEDLDGQAFHDFRQDLLYGHDFNVMGFPTLIMQNGRLEKRVRGIAPYEELEEMLTIL